MKRFYKDVSIEPVTGGWQVMLDGRGIKTQQGNLQIVPSEVLAEALAEEWRGQGEQIDPNSLKLRDHADYAIDVVAPDPAVAIASMLTYAETDTLCYRADPDEPLFLRQLELWEPLLARAEQRLGLKFERVSGIVHRHQRPETLAALKSGLEARDPFTLAALQALTSLSASLVIGLEALEDDAEAEALWQAANCEEDWQAEQWGWERSAETRRAARFADFSRAIEFARLARRTSQ
ncbi:MAG TPA: ATP12 family protein [Sphingomonadaceae bacterium]|nr:ATP12 family protein [Sphingomonadaceae bacterium]